MLFEKYFHGKKDYHLETYLLNFEAISPFYQFLLKFEFTCPGLICFLSSLPSKEVVAMQEAIAMQIKVG